MSWIALGAGLGLVLLAATIRAGGASLLRTSVADAIRDAAQGVSGADRVAEMLRHRSRVQPALGLTNTALLVSAALLGGWALTRRTEDGWVWVGLAAMAVLIVVVGDWLPRTVGRANVRRLAYWTAPLLAGAVRLGQRAVDLVEEEEHQPLPPSDNQAEKMLISSVLEFADVLVAEIMVPRPDIVAIAGIASARQALALATREGVSRIPVTGKDVDDIVGILYVKDLLALPDDEETSVARLMRRPFVVPDTKRISELLKEMQARKVHMAIVLDEFGGTAGLVTIEDILEELVGEIADEFDTEEPEAVKLTAQGDYLLDGRLPVDEFEKLMGVAVPDEEWYTVGGLVLGLAGRVPREGEVFVLQDIELSAERMHGRRVALVRATRR